MHLRRLPLIFGLVMLLHLLAGCIRPASTRVYQFLPVEETEALPAVGGLMTALPTPDDTIEPPAPADDAVGLPEMLTVFPLYTGSAWVYHYTAYAEEATAEMRVVDTLVDVGEWQGSYFAQINRQTEIITGSENLYYLSIPMNGVYFWIVQENRIYLAVGTLPQNLNDAMLAYQMPLAAGDAWVSETWADNLDCEINQAACRFVLEPETVTLLSDAPAACIVIANPYLSGVVYETFCDGVGVFGGKYDHNGSSFGYQFTLSAYSLQQPD